MIFETGMQCVDTRKILFFNVLFLEPNTFKKVPRTKEIHYETLIYKENACFQLATNFRLIIYLLNLFELISHQ